MSKILFGINTLTTMSQVVYANHIQYFTRARYLHKDDQFMLFTPIRATIDKMRNLSVRVALENEVDYIVFIDDDVLLPVEIDSLARFKKADKDVVAGWTVIRGYPFNNMFFKQDKESGGLTYYNDDIQKDEVGLIRCAAVGCSYVMIKAEVFKKIPPPYFVTGEANTEDVYFCMKAKSYLPDIGIYVDPEVKTHHVLNPFAVSADNKAILAKLEEALEPEIKKQQKAAGREDRGDEYITKVEKLFDVKV